MNARKRHIICLRGWRGFHLGNQVRGVLLTGFGEMHLVANPGNVPTLGTVAGLGIMGRGDAISRRG